MPWITQSTRNNGDLRICCQANVGEDQGLIREGIEKQDVFYLLLWGRCYTPDPSSFTKSALADNNRFLTDTYKGLNLNLDKIRELAGNHSSIIKHLSVSKTMLVRAVYKEDDFIITGMLFKNKEDLSKYQEDSNTYAISEEFERQNFNISLKNYFF